MEPDTRLNILVRRGEIEATVERLAAEITRDYRDKNPIMIGILKGSFIFLADLARLLDFPLEIDFVRLASYGSGRETSGMVKMLQGIRSGVAGRRVLVVEDIVDTGITVAFFLESLKRKKPDSVRLCALLDKPSRRRVPVNINYLGMTVPDKFLVGYGLDYDEKYRNLPDIYFLEEAV